MEEMIRDTAEKVFAGPDEAANAARIDPALWQQANDAGFAIALAAEDQGGLGLSGVEAFAPVRVAAARGVALPLGETVLANWLLSAAGLDVEEEACGVLCGDPAGQPVPFGRDLAAVVVVGEGRLSVLRPTAEDWVRAENMAGEARDSLATVPAAETEATLPVTQEMVEGALAMLRAVQCAAATRAALEMSLEYCNTREQFGRSLSQFQAIQTQLAVMAAESCSATMAADMVLAAFDERDTVPERFLTAVAVARVRTSEAATRAAATAHQVHGAIGFSGEYALHPLTRRMWCWRDEAGTEEVWAERLGQSLLSKPVGDFWPWLTDQDFKTSAEAV